MIEKNFSITTNTLTKIQFFYLWRIYIFMNSRDNPNNAKKKNANLSKSFGTVKRNSYFISALLHNSLTQFNKLEHSSN